MFKFLAGLFSKGSVQTPVKVPANFKINTAAMIPLAAGQAVTAGWPTYTGKKPLGVTWHWTVTRNLGVCRAVLGGANAQRKGEASAHFGVGRSFAEGIDQYVAIENRSWHAGKGQTTQWDGKPMLNSNMRGVNTTIGIETVSMGFEAPGVKSEKDWYPVVDPSGRVVLKIQPWTEEQIAMMIHLGKMIVAKYPNITWRDHHGHHDICPGYKLDVVGFPFARILRGIYDDPTIPDVWTPFHTVEARQEALQALGYTVGGVDGQWGRLSQSALEKFQKDHGLVDDAMWTTYESRIVWELLNKKGSSNV
jgi:N-acetyl-anhydromuramyl-L-alanine amidase AmpD